jgi:hypothetical protein
VLEHNLSNVLTSYGTVRNANSPAVSVVILPEQTLVVHLVTDKVVNGCTSCRVYYPLDRCHALCTKSVIEVGTRWLLEDIHSSGL